ncbi:MAG: energy transducer TonB [Sphingomonas sp.]
MILAGVFLFLQAQEMPQPLAPLNLREWIKNDDYPPSALRERAQGIVGFDLTVDAAGRVSHCVVTDSSKSAALDEQTCLLLTERARFRPAKDAHGESIPAIYRNRARWELPKIDPIPVAAWHSVGVIDVAAGGRVLSCEDRSVGAVPKFFGKPCDDFRGGLPPDMLRMIGGGSAEQILTFETAMRFDDIPEPILRYSEAGQIGNARMKLRFEITESGAVENCGPVPTGEEHWMATMPSPCSRLKGPFAPRSGPDGKPLRSFGTIVIAISRKL